MVQVFLCELLWVWGSLQGNVPLSSIRFKLWQPRGNPEETLTPGHIHPKSHIRKSPGRLRKCLKYSFYR